MAELGGTAGIFLFPTHVLFLQANRTGGPALAGARHTVGAVAAGAPGDVQQPFADVRAAEVVFSNLVRKGAVGTLIFALAAPVMPWTVSPDFGLLGALPYPSQR